jgi:hypothetical protein
MPVASIDEAHSTKTRNAIPSNVDTLLTRRAHKLRRP